MGLALDSLAAAFTADVVSSALIRLAVGVVLCFFGTRSLRLTGICVGFVLGGALAEALGASVAVALLVGVGGAIAGLLAVNLVLRWAVFAIGALAGATVAASMYRHFAPGEDQLVLVVLVVGAVAVISGFIVGRFRDPMLAAVTALAGASCILTGVARLLPDALGFFEDPTSSGQSVLTAACLLLLALAGWIYQRRWQLSHRAVGR